MGIPGLLEHLKSVITRSHIRDFSGMRVAVDAHCWLHRGAFACSKELVLGNPTEKYIAFFMNMVGMLKCNGITSILVVFDGQPLPNKSETNRKRSDDRKKNIALAREAEAMGDQKLAMTYYQRSVSVTFDMIQRLLTVLEKEGVSYMISPYESDAQLAFFSKTNTVDLIITEDSDSIPYGCSAVMFKMDKEGYGELFEQSKLHTNQTLSFANWTDDQFKLFCCLSGCDYMPGLRNFGIKTAYKVVQKYKTFSKVLEHLSFSSAASEYQGHLGARLEQALLTFKHQTIFNPFAGCTEPLTPLPLSLAYLNTNQHTSGNTATATVAKSTASRSALTVNMAQAEFAFLGPLFDPAVALQLAKGEIDPKSIVIPGSHDDALHGRVHCVGTGTVLSRASTPDAGHFTGFVDTNETTTQYSTSTPAALNQQSNSIRWFSSEDRALHTAHAHQRLHSTATTSNTFDDLCSATNTLHHATSNRKYDSTTPIQPVVGRKRGRSGAQSTVPNPLPHSHQGTIASISTAGAMYATSVYQSDLISDTLVPLHRRTRLRSVEPTYSTHLTSNKVAESDTNNYITTGTTDNNLFGNEDNSVSFDVWDAQGDETDNWDQHSSFPVAAPSYTTDRTFFKDASPDKPTFNTSACDISAQYESSCVDDDYMYAADDHSALINPLPLWDNTSPFTTADGHNDTFSDTTGGLKQFQDRDFNHRFAHQYTLHPAVGVSDEMFLYNSGPIRSAQATNCYSNTPMHESSMFLQNRSVLPDTLHNNLTDYTNRNSTTTSYYNYADCSTNNTNGTHFLQHAGVLDESWKHQQFPGLLRS